MLRQIIILIFCFVLVTTLVGCATATHDSSQRQIAHSNRQTVLVTITGDVVNPGQWHIRPDFSEDSIQEVSGGSRVYSEGGFASVSFKLTRHFGGKTQSWVVLFNDMNTSKWKGFQFEEGDEIYVIMAIF